MATFSAGAFRTAFPEFQDAVAYPDQLINGWAALAQAQVVAARWGSQWLLGVHLYVAHEITIEAQQKKAAAAGGTPGGFGGVATTKTVGSATVGYDAQTTTEKDAGFWNLTTYGKQFIRLARVFGAGCVQL